MNSKRYESFKARYAKAINNPDFERDMEVLELMPIIAENEPKQYGVKLALKDWNKQIKQDKLSIKASLSTCYIYRAEKVEWVITSQKGQKILFFSEQGLKDFQNGVTVKNPLKPQNTYHISEFGNYSKMSASLYDKRQDLKRENAEKEKANLTGLLNSGLSESESKIQSAIEESLNN